MISSLSGQDFRRPYFSELSIRLFCCKLFSVSCLFFSWLINHLRESDQDEDDSELVYIFFHKSTNVNYYVSLFVDIPIDFVDVSVGFSMGFSITGNYFQYVGTSNGQNPTSWPQKKRPPTGSRCIFQYVRQKPFLLILRYWTLTSPARTL